MENYNVELAHDGREGLLLAQTNHYDLIILDIMLPGVDGLELCKTLRRGKIMTPVLMVTARDTDQDRLMSLEAGADDFLVKPFIFKELTQRIKRLLDQSSINKTQTKNSKSIEKSNERTNNVLSEKKKAEPISKESNKKIQAKKKVDLLTLVSSAREQSKGAEEIEGIIFNKSILDNAPVSIITIDKKGDITFANKYYQTFSNTNDYKGHNIFDSNFFIRENLVVDYKELLSSGRSVRRESCYEKNNLGEDKYLKIIAVALRDQRGEINGALSMAIDNTEAILYKNELIELNNDLEIIVEQRTEQLNKVNEELHKVLKLKTIFMGDVTHELRTSLAIIQGNLELMSMVKSIDKDNLESQTQIINEIGRMSGMLADLTMLANSDSSNQKLIYKKVDLNQLILSACKSLRAVAHNRNIRIEYKKSQDLLELMGDKNKLEKLILNLIGNAIKYNKDNGWVKVHAEIKNNLVIVSVADGGIGIAQDHFADIFERFYQVDKARTRIENGSGLGLAICKWIVDMHGGKIEIESQEGIGSVFTVRLPSLNIGVDNVV